MSEFSFKYTQYYNLGVSATDWPLVQRSPTDCGVSCVWSRNLENEEAKARYRPVENTTTMVCNAKNTNNKYYNLGKTI